MRMSPRSWRGEGRKSGQHGAEHPFALHRTRELEGPQLSGGSWRLQPREALLAEFSVQENSPVLTICTSIHLLCLFFFSHLLFPASRLYFQTLSVFFIFFFCCETQFLLEQRVRVSVRSTCYMTRLMVKSGLNRDRNRGHQPHPALSIPSSLNCSLSSPIVTSHLPAP